jgi:putative ABC transport system permease protein
LRQVDGRAPEPRNTWTPLTWMTVGGEYFQTVGAKLVRGRWFNEHDRSDSLPVVVIDEATARRYWPGEDPIGRRLKGQDPRGRNDEWLTVVGVVRNMRRQGLEREPTPHIFEWYLQSLNPPRDIVVLTASEPSQMLKALRDVALSLDASAVVSQATKLSDELESMTLGRRFQTTLMTVFAALAFVLAAVGIFGVLNYAVTIRTREFGIRAALGESAAMLRARVLRDALRVSLPGVAIGIAAALALATVLRSVLYGVSPLDPVALGSAVLLLLIVAALAGLGPAWKAGHTDPASALRQD